MKPFSKLTPKNINLLRSIYKFAADVDVAVESWHVVGVTFEMTNFRRYIAINVGFSTNQIAVVCSAANLRENPLK